MQKLGIVIISIIIFSCAYIHDPFRSEEQRILGSTTTTTPAYSASVYCKLTRHGKVIFSGLPDAPTHISIYYRADNLISVKINGIPGFYMPKTIGQEIFYDPQGSYSKKDFTLEIDESNSSNVLYVEKICWSETENVHSGAIYVVDLPDSAFSGETSLIELR